ncbi:MAG: site-2 protease family protein [Thermoprotei archaeon]|nr:MAG: site-2 protease family protein [Thermoprotei archaeon]
MSMHNESRRPSILNWFLATEFRQLLLSALVIAFAFSIRYLVFGKYRLEYVSATILAVILAFIPHELSHRHIARKLGYYARYRVWLLGLALAIVFPLLTLGSLIFAAPGAVVIYPKYPFGYVSRRDYGLIALAGPLANIIVGYTSLVLLTMMKTIIHMYSFLLILILFVVMEINLWLAMFNLIPFPPLDGSKVFAWNKALWLVAFALSAVPLFLMLYGLRFFI